MTLDEPRRTRWGRRVVVIPAYAAALVLLLGLAPVALPAVAALDLARGRRLAGARVVVFALVYLTCELGGLAAAGVAGLLARSSGRRWLDWHYALQSLWARTLFGAARALFSLEVTVTGDAAVGRGPLLVFSRHVSLADTLLPAVFVTHRHGLRLRYVLKRELLGDPCLDLVGQRLPNAFVRRGSADSVREIALVRALAAGMGAGEGVLIYPEGTRFTPAKRERALAAIGRGDPARRARLEGLRHVLPPQLGGPLALLEARPDADVLFLAHAGLEGATTLGDFWRGTLVGGRLRVAFWRVPAADIPRDDAARVAWVDAQWAAMDAWVDAH